MTIRVAVLKSTKLFADLSRGELIRVANIIGTKAFSEGATIFSEGEIGDEVYVILSGEVRITKRSRDGEPQPLTILKQGETFGEMSFFTGLPHSATAEALTGVDLLVLTKEVYERFASLNPDIGYKIALRAMRIVAEVLADMNNRFMDMMNYLWRWR